MGEFLRYTIFGLAVAGVYFIAASGLVVTYTASGIFNFAHGAVAMIAAFTYWDLRVQHDWPAPLALAAVLLVGAPLAGIVIERVIMRNLSGAATITGIVVTIGLLVALLGVGTVVWAPSKFAQTPSLPRFFESHVVNILGAPIAWHYLFVLAFSVFVALGLWVLLRNTRLGIAMRAVVDDRNLARLNGENPELAAAASWVIGCMLAALAGVLLAPILALDVARLTLLVINAYVVAVVGRLRSLPLAALGAVILGFSLSYFDWGLAHVEHVPVWVQSIHDSLPIIMLFVVLLVMPQDRTRLTATLRSAPSTAVSTPRTAIVAASRRGRGVVRGGVHPRSGPARGRSRSRSGHRDAVARAVDGLRGPDLTGAARVRRLGSVGRVVAAGPTRGIARGVARCRRVRRSRRRDRSRFRAYGCATSTPLGTMAFALVVEQNVLGQIPGFATDSKAFVRWNPMQSDKAYFVAIAVTFVLLAWLLIALRRGEFGRRLQAMKDSPTACTMVGTRPHPHEGGGLRPGAAIAGIGGFLMAGWKGTVGKDDFSVLTGAAVGVADTPARRGRRGHRRFRER